MSAAGWFKWYPSDFLNGIADLSPNEIAVYAVLISMIYDAGGPVADAIPPLSRRCNMRPSSCKAALDGLVERGKIVRSEGKLTNPRCEREIETRQKVSEKSAEAARSSWQYRRKKPNETNEGHERPHTPSTSGRKAYQIPEPDKNRTLPSEASPSPPVDEAQEGFDAYNAEAAVAGWPKAATLNPKRRAGIKARIHDAGGLGSWRAALARARASPFLTGQNDRGWLPDLDFFLQAKSFTRLIEGGYDRRTPPQRPQHASRGVDYAAAVDQVFGGRDGTDRDNLAPPADDRGGQILDFAAAGRSYLLA